MTAAMNGAEEILAAGFDPLNGLPGPHRDEAHKSLFGVDIEFGAEAAADLGSDEADAVFFEPQHGGKDGAREVRNLGGCVDIQRAVGFAPLGDDAAGFHRAGNETLAGDALPDDDVGFLESLIDVAAALAERAFSGSATAGRTS